MSKIAYFLREEIGSTMLVGRPKYRNLEEKKKENEFEIGEKCSSKKPGGRSRNLQVKRITHYHFVNKN